jgi:ketopantoate hydroxymethyltransferase
VSEKATSRLTVTDISQHKGSEKIVMLTAYTTPIARLLDPAAAARKTLNIGASR